MGISSRHLQCSELERMLDALPFIVQVTLVGLGEPLLHPKLADVLRILKQRRLRTGLVTNGMALTPEKAQMLIKLGLDSITFSLDCMDRDIFEHLRKGADFLRIIENIRNLVVYVYS
ncbi:MAG: radical SAM protein [Desulfobacterales bacterium]|nr:radical SAM protein [Desulfobacterales bacterium]